MLGFMTAKKISQLSLAATPLTGAELIPAVQSNASVRVKVKDILALGQFREALADDLTFHVLPDGDDDNDGLTAETAFATRQKAWDTTAQFDLNGHTVTIQLADGAHTTPLTATKVPLGQGSVVFAGNPASPTNVVISTTSADCYTFPSSMLCTVTIQDQKLQTTTSGNGVLVFGRVMVNVSNLTWGAVAVVHIQTSGPGAQITETGNCEILGNFTYHASCGNLSRIVMRDRTHKITGALACAGAYAQSTNAAHLQAINMTFDLSGGSLTGKRFNTSKSGIIDTGTDTGLGANLTYFPGSIAGTTAQGGSYW